MTGSAIMGNLNREPLTIEKAVEAYINSIELSRSKNTARTYRNGMNLFLFTLQKAGLDPETDTTFRLEENLITGFADFLKRFSPATERLYLTAAALFYEYLSAENLKDVNLARIRVLIRQRARRPGQRLPQFPNDAIEMILDQIDSLRSEPSEDQNEHLRNVRDRAFLITLADTGLRVHEACALRRGDIDWNEGQAVIIGKGNKQAVIRFSTRALTALTDYLNARAKLDGVSGKPLRSLPLFARHDKGAGNKIKPITTATGRHIVHVNVQKYLGDEAVGTITPHSFRHFFVTRVLRASGNLKLAQELARHQNIAVTTRYAHLSDDELDKGYYHVFEKQSPAKE